MNTSLWFSKVSMTRNRLMMLIASLSAAFLAIPSKVAIAQTPLENQTMPGNLTEVARVIIPIDLRQCLMY
jgi:hypothetical protein